MAMAKVFLPELLSMGGAEDPALSFPRAPPPSPEMQPQGHSELFEIPASKFEGIGLDLKRTSFPLDEEDEDDYPVHLLEQLGFNSVPLGDFPGLCSGGDTHEDDILACSPRKRVCCASSTTISTHHTVTTFPSSSATNSLISNGFGGYNHTTNISVGFSNGIGNNSMPIAPTFLTSSSQIQAKPHVTPLKIEGVMKDPVKTTTNFTLRTSPSGSTGGSQQHILTGSSDLHTTHPHLPHSFEATQLSEASSTLPHALNSTSLHEALLPSQQALEGDQEAGQRKRKISIKRKNPEESDSDSALQFSFDHSHSSNGSGGESDWVLVERQTDSNWPSEKKACSAMHQAVLAHSLQPQHYVLDGSSTPSGGVVTAIVNPVEQPCSVRITAPFLDTGARHEEGASKEQGNIAIRNQVAEFAVMMDLGRHGEDLEKMEVDHHTSMECGSNVPTLLSSTQDGAHVADVYPRELRSLPSCPQASEAYLHDLLALPVRHSYVEGFLHQQSRSDGLCWLDANGEQLGMDTRLPLSKSL